MITLEPITPENALVFKDVRLRALKDSPLAFASTYAKESQIPEQEWLIRSVRWSSEGSIGYIAMDGADACGLVACYAEDHPPRGHVISMWVAPEYRRAGVGRALIDALSAWALARGLPELRLMVTSVNEGAVRFYERMGFRMSGNVGPYPNDPSITESEMLMPL